MASRPSGIRLRRAVLSALVVASVAVPVSGAARPAEVPAPVPATSGTVPVASTQALSERYAATRADLGAAERTATAHGDGKRAAALREFRAPGR